MVEVTLKDLRKTYNDGQVIAVDDVDLHIEQSELIVLVGPSGCGKSTTLRTIAGLETPDSGSVTFGDHNVTNLPPKDREISMVFQNYALYPSMTVYENMAFGLKMRGEDKNTIDEQVRWATDIMGITDLLERYPKQLSGGQQQRVALGRAIVRNPAVFLLDEPLSNLDAKLRTTMRTEIQELQKELDVATVFVTHDQQEAMSMGDRIAVMNAGDIQQVGAPEEIYHNPNSLFVADFVGSPEINFFEMTFNGDHVEGNNLHVDIPTEVANELEEGVPADDVILGIRPEDIDITEPETGLIDIEIDVVEPMGDRNIIYLTIDGRQVNAIVPSTAEIEEGDIVGIDVVRSNIHFFSPAGEKITTFRHAVHGSSVRPSDALVDEALTEGTEMSSEKEGA